MNVLLHVYTYILCKPGVQEGQKALEPRGLEGQMAVSHHMGARNGTRVL